MPLQRLYLLDREVQSSNAATREEELPKTGRLSAIHLRIECTNGATSGTEQLVDAIDLIEVRADGSWPIFSCTGRSAYALNALWQKRRPSQVRSMAASAVQELNLVIPFGFFIGDPAHALDLARFRRISLRIQYSPTIAATAFATGTFTITAHLIYWREGDAPGGGGRYLRYTEIKNWTSAASGDETVLLPVQFPLLGVLIFSREAAIALETDITRIRMLTDVSGLEIFNARTEDLAYQNHVELGLEAIERGVALRGDTDTIDVDVNFLQSVHLTPVFTMSDANGVLAANLASFVGDRITLSASETADAAATTHFTAWAAIRQIHWTAIGRGLPHALWVPMSRWGAPDTAYPVAGGGQPRLLVTQGGAGADVRPHALELAS